MARSAKIAELKLDTGRVPEQPSTTLLGTVGKIIPSVGSSKPEKAQNAVDGPDRGYRDLRIENALTDEHGDDVKLKKGAHVEVEGELRSREYERDGSAHRVFECRVESILKLDRAARQETPELGEDIEP